MGAACAGGLLTGQTVGNNAEIRAGKNAEHYEQGHEHCDAA
jgi:hypothetical protein